MSTAIMSEEIELENIVENDTRDDTIDDSRRTKCWTINKHRIPLKILFFNLYSGIDCILPVFYLYLRQFGLTTIEIGVVTTITAFVPFISQPLIGLLADRYQKHKLIFCVVLVICAAIFIIWSRLPQILDQEVFDLFTIKPHMTLQPFNKSYEPITNESISLLHQASSTVLRTCDVPTSKTTGLENFRTEFYLNNSSLVSLFHDPANTAVEYVFNATDKSSFDVTVKHFRLGEDSACLLKCEVVDYSEHIMSTRNDVAVSCHRQHNSKYMFGKMFYIVTVMSIFQKACITMTKPLMNAVAYGVLQENMHHWGQQRLFGSIGTGTVVYWSGLIIDAVSHKSITHYQPAYYIAAIFMCLSIISIIFTQIHDIKYESHFPKVVLSVGTKPDVILFYVLNFLMGLYHNAISEFILLFLNDIQVENSSRNQSFLGLMISVTILSEIPLFIVSGIILKRLGELPSFYVSLALYAVCFLILSFITKSWMAILVSPIQGIKTVLFVVASNSYARKLVPADMLATSMGMMLGIRTGLGNGLGALLTSTQFFFLGPRTTYRIYSASCVLFLLAYVLIQECILKRRKQELNEKSTTSYGTLNAE